MQKIYNETKDEGIKTKLGELLFIHLDHLSKLPNPMHYHLAENIEKLHIAINQQKNNEKNLEKLLDQAIIAFSKLDQPTVQNSSSSVQSSESKTEKKDTPNTITETKITQNKRPPNPRPRQERLAALTSRVTAATNPQQLRQISKSNISSGEILQQNAQRRLAAAQSPRVNPQTSKRVDEAIRYVSENLDFFAAPLEDGIKFQLWSDKHSSLIKGPSDQLRQALTNNSYGRPIMFIHPYIDALIGSHTLLENKKEECLRNGNPEKLHLLLQSNPALLDAIHAFKNSTVVNQWYKTEATPTQHTNRKLKRSIEHMRLVVEELSSITNPTQVDSLLLDIGKKTIDLDSRSQKSWHSDHSRSILIAKRNGLYILYEQLQNYLKAPTPSNLDKLSEHINALYNNATNTFSYGPITTSSSLFSFFKEKDQTGTRQLLEKVTKFVVESDQTMRSSLNMNRFV